MIKSLCLLVLVYLLLIYFSIWLLNVKRRSNCYDRSNVNKTNENSTFEEVALHFCRPECSRGAASVF
jgi:hypothetical protein